MKKLLMATAMVVVSAASAQAQIDLNIGIGDDRPVYVEPRPVYVAPHPAYYPTYGRDKHSRAYDYEYWRDHRGPERYDDDRHDHGRHEGWDKHDRH